MSATRPPDRQDRQDRDQLRGWMHPRARQLRPMGPVEPTYALAILLALGAFIWAALIGLAAAAVIAGQLVLILVVGEPVGERLLRDHFEALRAGRRGW